MTIRHKAPLALMIAQTIALTACGGGSGSDNGGGSGGTVTAKTLSPHQIDEGQSQAFSLEGLGAASTATSNSDLIDASLSGANVAIKAAQVDRPASAVVTIQNNDDQAIGRMTIAINNTSAAPTEKEVSAFVAGQTQLLTLAEARAYYDLETAQAYMDGNIDGDTYQSLKDDWTVGEQNSYQTLQTALEALEKRQADYEKGRIGEDELADSLRSAEVALTDHNQYADERFDVANGQDATIAFPNAGSLTYYAPSKSLSRFVGNRALGQQGSSGWAFDAGQEKYELLTTFRAKADRYAGEVQ